MFKECCCTTASSGLVSKMVIVTQKELTCDSKWQLPERFTPELINQFYNCYYVKVTLMRNFYVAEH